MGDSVRIEAVPTVADVLAEWDPLFAAAPAQSTRAWFAATEDAALPKGRAATYILCRDGGLPAAVFPMATGPSRLSSLTTPYTALYQPLIAPSLDNAALERIGLAFGRACRGVPTVLLEALDPDWAALAPLLAGVGRAGFVRQRFDHFGNWRQPVAGWSWEQYLATRQGALRETIRRKTRAALRDSHVRIELARDPAALGPALLAYEQVYARSWKEPEPFPRFNQALLPRLAAQGALRLGVMWAGDLPVAAQYWIVWGGVATVLKLAHDEAFKAHSPGTVLTAWMIRGLIEQDGVAELDFGRGDDDYKRLWTSMRRQRVGVLLANPWRAGGVGAILRHQAGLARRSLQRFGDGLRGF